MICESVSSPIGPLVLVEEKGVLLTVAFEHRWSVAVRHLQRHWSAFELRNGRCLARRAINSFFEGDLSALKSVDCYGPGTVFQRGVWSQVAAIPCGQTQSYKQIAQALGRPLAIRAVANAIGANPLAVVVPCHRVIGSSGKLTGFGGGLEKKCALLQHEGVDV